MLDPLRDPLKDCAVVPQKYVDALLAQGWVKVVRCKDCFYWRREVNATTHWVCAQHSYDGRLLHTTPDFYCADGKLRDGGDDNGKIP